jgi:hypothetical protein
MKGRLPRSDRRPRLYRHRGYAVSVGQNARTKPPRFVTLRQAGAAGADTASLVTTGESLVAIHK